MTTGLGTIVFRSAFQNLCAYYGGHLRNVEIAGSRNNKLVSLLGSVSDLVFK